MIDLCEINVLLLANDNLCGIVLRSVSIDIFSTLRQPNPTVLSNKNKHTFVFLP